MIINLTVAYISRACIQDVVYTEFRMYVGINGQGGRCYKLIYTYLVYFRGARVHWNGYKSLVYCQFGGVLMFMYNLWAYDVLF